MRTILVIPELKYPHNGLQSLRSAEAFGCSEICIVRGKKLIYRLPKGEMRAHKHMKISIFHSNEDILNYLIKERIKIMCIENSKDALLLGHFTFPTKLALIMGHENQGVPEEFLNNYRAIKIPQFGVMGCLNTTVAMSIVLYERFKERLKI